jgi:hypothetical protein
VSRSAITTLRRLGRGGTGGSPIAACPVLEACRRECDRAERLLPHSLVYGTFAGETPRERISRRKAMAMA